jgi:hypothetical protein
VIEPRFWLLRTPDRQRLGEETDTKYERVDCPVTVGHIRAGKRTSDLSIMIDPRGVRDFTWTWYSDILVKQHVLDIFTRERVTGYEIRPARILFPKNTRDSPPETFELVVTGWGGVGAPAAKVRLRELCEGCKHTVYTIGQPNRLIDVSAWDGSDLFFVWPLPRFRFVSDRLARILKREGITGIKLIPSKEIPIKKGGGASPGKLERWIPEQRAAELKQRFGI